MGKYMNKLNTQTKTAVNTENYTKAKDLLQDFLNVVPDKISEVNSAAKVKDDSTSYSASVSRKKRAHFSGDDRDATPEMQLRGRKRSRSRGYD